MFFFSLSVADHSVAMFLSVVLTGLRLGLPTKVGHVVALSCFAADFSSALAGTVTGFGGCLGEAAGSGAGGAGGGAQDVMQTNAATVAARVNTPLNCGKNERNCMNIRSY